MTYEEYLQKWQDLYGDEVRIKRIVTINDTDYSFTVDKMGICPFNTTKKAYASLMNNPNPSYINAIYHRVMLLEENVV